MPDELFEPVDGQALELSVLLPSNATEPDMAWVAYQYHLGGYTWSEAAEKAGYASGRSAQTSVKAWLQKEGLARSMQERSDAFDTEIDRLEMLHKAFWPKALMGDDKAAGIVLRTHEARAKLYGLQELLTQLGQNTNGRVILISDQPGQFVKDLEAITEGDS